MPQRKSWREKLADDKGLPKVGRVEGKMIRRWGTGTMVIPAPREVDAIMKTVKRGKLITINEIRGLLAKKHGAKIACPITTGIFAWIASHAAEEDAAEGKKRITPYWRTLKTGGELNPKYPGGIEALKRKLKAEGHQVIAKGKRFFVADYANSVVARGLALILCMTFSSGCANVRRESPNPEVFHAVSQAIQEFRPRPPTPITLHINPRAGTVQSDWYPIHKGEAVQRIVATVQSSDYQVDVWQRPWFFRVDGIKTDRSQSEESRIETKIQELLRESATRPAAN